MQRSQPPLSGAPLSRRAFLRRAAVGASIVSLAPFNILSAANAGDQVRCAVIGCGSRGMNHVGAILNDRLVAMVDVDEQRFVSVKQFLKERGREAGKLRVFTDYRRMFDKLAKQIDAVFIASPNHQHVLPAMLALQAGLHVYCEKPLSHTIAEARMLRQMAADTKVATQMGHQGHCEEGYRRLCEYIGAGVIGQVTETHSWTNRANGGLGPRPPKKRPPSGLHWDEWIGPAPYRAYHDDLHPHSWHGWFDFGNGSIGNMGCHVLDGVYWALKVEHPESVELEQIRGGSDERYPVGARIRWDVPARGELPPLKAYWYEGLKPEATSNPGGIIRAAADEDRYLPPVLLDQMKKHPDEELGTGDSGTIYVGEKGIIFTGTYGDKMHVVPWEKMRETPAPPKTLPRPRSVFEDFLTAVRNGKTETAAGFDYGARLTEFTLLGNLAVRAGVGKKVKWDGPAMQVTNLPELNRWVKRAPRRGWKV